MSLNCLLSPPQDMEPEKVCEWIPLEGWIASSLPFKEVHLISQRVKDISISLSPFEDRSRLSPEYASKFIQRFKSRITVREMLGETEAGTIIAKVIYESGSYDLVQIDMPRYKFRNEKTDKRNKLLPILACPYCRKPLDSAKSGLRCRECDRCFPFTGNSYNFLTDDLKDEFSISPTANVSDHSVGGAFRNIILANPDRIFLDVGAGFKTNAYSNMINFEIVDYPSTDVLGVGEKLPFSSASMDGVFCDCVLEHVMDPFACAREIMRVLKPGGYLYCTVPFLQPVHAYPNHFYNMTQQGLVNLFQGMDIRETYVPDNLHPMAGLVWILKAYFLGLPEKEKREFAGMSVLDILQTFPMGSHQPDHPLIKALPQAQRAEIACGNTLIAIKPGAACDLKGASG